MGNSLRMQIFKRAYNKLCKVTANDAMNVKLGLKKIESLKLDKKNLLVKLFDSNELLNNVKTENMLLLDKVKSLELDLSVARSASSKLDQMLNVQKSPSNKSGLGFFESISMRLLPIPQILFLHLLLNLL